MSYNTKNKHGGEVIGVGGFGCIFKPALKCKNSRKRTNGISKLSSKYNINNEWVKLMQIKKYIKKIPNYEKYFLLANLSKCQPDPLTVSDLKNISQCDDIIQSMEVNINNINDNLNKFDIINMPYGGIELTKVIQQYIIPIPTINIILINLLLHGIIPMNNLKIYHFDLKSQNLLYKNNLIRIIDFGLLGISTPYQIIPQQLYNKKLQFNSPFSRILFTQLFDFELDKYLTVNKVNYLEFKELQLFMLKYYRNFKNKNGIGHEPVLTKYILPEFFKLGNLLPPKNFDILEYLVSTYCANILIKYINYSNRTFDQKKYFMEVYSKNVDIYGFIMSYLPIILYTKENVLYTQYKIVVTNIIIKYCFSSQYATIPININELINDLKELNSLKQNYQLNLELFYKELERKSKKSKSKKSKSKKSKSKKSKSKKSKSKSKKSKKSKSKKSKSKKSKSKIQIINS